MGMRPVLEGRAQTDWRAGGGEGRIAGERGGAPREKREKRERKR